MSDVATGLRIERRFTAEGQDPVSFEQMKEHLLAKGLRKQALPEQLEFLDVLPRNPTGKVVKYELRDQYAA